MRIRFVTLKTCGTRGCKVIPQIDGPFAHCIDQRGKIMKRSCYWTVALVAILAVPNLSHADWPQWRGPLGTGVAPDTTPPIEWNPDTNVLWKAKIDGEGHGTPVVAGGIIFLTTSVPVGDPITPRSSGRPGAHDNRKVASAYQFQAWAINSAEAQFISAILTMLNPMRLLIADGSAGRYKLSLG